MPARRRPGWLAPAAVVASGIAAGMVAGSPPSAGPVIALLIVIGASLYRPVLGLAGLAILAPFAIALPVPLPASLALVLVAALGVAWLIRSVLDHDASWQSGIAYLPLVAFAGLTAFSLFGFTGHLDEELSGLIVAGAGFTVFLLVTQQIRNRTDFGLALSAILAGASLQAAIVVVRLINGQPVSEAFRASGSLTDPNHYAGSLVLVIPVTLALAIAAPKTWQRGVAGLLALLLAIAMVATLSRSGWLGLLAAVAILALLLPGQRWRMACVVLGVVVALVAFGLVAPVEARLAPHVTGPMEMLGSRWRVWMAALAIIGNHPLFGVGLGSFQYSYPAYATRPATAAHAHNLYLTLAAERGIPALVAFLAVLVGFFRSLAGGLARTDNLTDRVLIAGLAASLAGYLVHSLFEASYVSLQVLLLFWFVAGLAIVSPRSSWSR